MLEKLKFLFNVEKVTVFQRRNNVSLSMLNRRRYKVDFGLTLKKDFVVISGCLKN